jgi:hypothetical protein
MGRSAILGEQRNNYFCDVACGRGEMVSSFPFNVEVATVLGSIPASSDTVESEGAAYEAVLKAKKI